MKDRMWWQVLILMVVVVVFLGAGTQGRADAKKDIAKEILGRWDHYKSDTVYFRFYKDGQFRWVTLTGETTGSFRVLDDGVLELNTFHPQQGRKVTEFKYRLKDDTLEIKIGDDWHKYSKTK